MGGFEKLGALWMACPPITNVWVRHCSCNILVELFYISILLEGLVGKWHKTTLRIGKYVHTKKADVLYSLTMFTLWNVQKISSPGHDTPNTCYRFQLRRDLFVSDILETDR